MLSWEAGPGRKAFPGRKNFIGFLYEESEQSMMLKFHWINRFSKDPDRFTSDIWYDDSFYPNWSRKSPPSVWIQTTGILPIYTTAYRRVIFKMRAQHEKTELLIWVNENNEITGYGEKMETHRKGQLHRAFSIFLYDPERGKLLIQKRAGKKYHSGGLWSNSCCSHPRKGETWGAALSRCLEDELGIKTTGASLLQETPEPSVPSGFPSFSPGSDTGEEAFRLAGEFRYYSDYGCLSEHEWDYVFLCCRPFSDEEIRLNQNEAEEILWISPDKLDLWMKQHPEHFTSWFSPAYQFIKTALSARSRVSSV